jgi:hypothetical protein
MSRLLKGWSVVSTKVIAGTSTHPFHCIDYSCAYNSRQGWMYISENYIGFYSFLLSVETKLLLEMKNVADIKKEKSRRSVFSDALRIITKDNQEVSQLINSRDHLINNVAFSAWCSVSFPQCLSGMKYMIYWCNWLARQ